MARKPKPRPYAANLPAADRRLALRAIASHGVRPASEHLSVLRTIEAADKRTPPGLTDEERERFAIAARHPMGGDLYAKVEKAGRLSMQNVQPIGLYTNANAAELRAYCLAPAGIPRWVRVYDNGGTEAEGGSIDRYTVVFAKQSCQRQFPYLAMNAAPFHPQGFGQHGDHNGCPVDAQDGKWPPAIGRKNHLGTRIRFEDLPHDCKRCVWQDYADHWKIPTPTEYR